MTKSGKQNLSFFTLLFALFCVFHSETSADEIILQNGDRLTGKVKKMEKNTVIFETEYSEPVKINKDKILKISTSVPVDLHLSGGEVLKGAAVEAGDDRVVGVAGAAAAPLGEQHHGKPSRFRDLEHAVFLEVVHGALRARQHRVVIRGDDRLRVGIAEELAVDAAHSGDHPVGRGARNQVLLLAPLTLRRDDQGAVLDERPFVDEIRDVLARRSLACLSPLCDRVGAILVETEAVPLVDLGQIGSNLVERCTPFDVFHRRDICGVEPTAYSFFVNLPEWYIDPECGETH